MNNSIPDIYDLTHFNPINNTNTLSVVLENSTILLIFNDCVKNIKSISSDLYNIEDNKLDIDLISILLDEFNEDINFEEKMLVKTITKSKLKIKLQLTDIYINSLANSIYCDYLSTFRLIIDDIDTITQKENITFKITENKGFKNNREYRLENGRIHVTSDKIKINFIFDISTYMDLYITISRTYINNEYNDVITNKRIGQVSLDGIAYYKNKQAETFTIILDIYKPCIEKFYYVFSKIILHSSNDIINLVNKKQCKCNKLVKYDEKDEFNIAINKCLCFYDKSNNLNTEYYSYKYIIMSSEIKKKLNIRNFSYDYYYIYL